MFAITKLSAGSQFFMSEMAINNQSRSVYSSLALAKAFTYCASLPSAPLEDFISFYRTHVQMEIEKQLNTLNELLVLDTKTIMDFCMKFWQLRYQTAHPSCHVFTFNKESAIEDFFGISRAFDKQTLNAIKEEPIKLSSYVNKYQCMINELFCSPGDNSSSSEDDKTMGGL